jgi:hypothetical protein
MPYIVGFVIVAGIIYWAFIRKETDTEEQTIKKIAQTAIVLFVVVVIALLVIFN